MTPKTPTNMYYSARLSLTLLILKWVGKGILFLLMCAIVLTVIILMLPFWSYGYLIGFMKRYFFSPILHFLEKGL